VVTTRPPSLRGDVSVGAREAEWGREGLDGRPRPVPCAHLWGNAIPPIDGLASRPTRV
jgi:hypothetical protein